ncbi:hypothetical protein ACFSLT_18380 [Novosphingobium resinovorum]
MTALIALMTGVASGLVEGERTDHADGLRQLDDVALGDLVDNADRLVVDDVVKGGAGLDRDLLELALVVAELGFLDGLAGDFLVHAGLAHGVDHAADPGIDLLLRGVLDLRLRGARTGDQFGDFGGDGGFGDQFGSSHVHLPLDFCAQVPSRPCVYAGIRITPRSPS